ncbi:putative nucleotidyltransferase [Prauserella muralis]|nr:putative nucleotidyltransferase [Prauserella muralis]
MAQSVISAYESNRREPGIRMLNRLIEATGHELSVELIPAPRGRLGLPDTRLGRRLRRHRRTVLELAAQRGARNVRVFGSVARGEDTADSDIDLLMDLDDNVGLVALAGLKRELAELLGVDVDVVPASTLKRAIRDQVLAEAISL